MGNIRELNNKINNNSDNIDKLTSVSSRIFSINYIKNKYDYEIDWTLTYPSANKSGIIYLFDFPENFVTQLNLLPIIKPQGSATYDSTQFLDLIPRLIYTLSEGTNKYIIRYYLNISSYTISSSVYYPYYKLLLTITNPQDNQEIITNKQ